MQAWHHPPGIWVVENEPLTRNPPPNPLLHRVAPPHNLGYAGGINAALRALPLPGPATILLMNTDVEVEEQDILSLQQGLSTSETAIIGPLLSEPGPSGLRLYAGGRDPIRWTHTRIPANSPTSPQTAWPRVAYVPGTLCLISRAVMDQLGGLEESFFFSGEIADFCLRARSQGCHATVLTGVVIAHDTESASARRDTLYLYYSLRNRFLLIRRHRKASAGVWRCMWFARGIAMILMRLARGQGASARAAWLAIRDGWSDRYGPNPHDFPA